VEEGAGEHKRAKEDELNEKATNDDILSRLN